ncbi:MAG TPA: MerR family transcriptional regulator [Lacipirellulaceae bacterium]|nr:MerR family transcriptional regulator [Lacipirellulaceae bacterium]
MADRSDSHDHGGDDGRVCRLYTPAMLAELLSVPLAAVRRWHRRGALLATRDVQRLPYFDFQEVAVARRLAQLLRAGCSLRAIDRRLAELARLTPGVERPLADPGLIVEGRRLYLRRGDELSEPHGQMLLDFDAPLAEDEEPAAVVALFRGGDPPAEEDSAHAAPGADLAGKSLVEHWVQEALDWEDEGRLDRAADAYRTLMMATGPTADAQFALADVLYRAGDLPAARERYYATLEIDEEFVEARASLGCVLAELGELELAAATFEGALAHHAEFADVHFHLAHVLDRMAREGDAADHYRTFLALAPQSPWADAARDRLAEMEAR